MPAFVHDLNPRSACHLISMRDGPAGTGAAARLSAFHRALSAGVWRARHIRTVLLRRDPADVIPPRKRRLLVLLLHVASPVRLSTKSHGLALPSNRLPTP